MMKQSLVTEFGWGVTTEYDEDDPEKVVQRTLHVTVLAPFPFPGPDGQALKIPVETIQIPFGTNPKTGKLTAETVGRMLLGEDVPVEIEVATKIPVGHLGPGGIPRR